MTSLTPQSLGDKIVEGAELADINALYNQMLKVSVTSKDNISPDTKWKDKHNFFCGENYGGFPLYSFKGDAYLDISDSHTLIIGATGSMKTRRLIAPGIRMLTLAGESMIIADPKAELYNRCSALMKEKGYNIYVLNFRNPASGDCWNPLYLPFLFMKGGDMSRCCETVYDFANSLIPSVNHDPYWNDSARNLLFDLCMLLMEMGKTGDDSKFLLDHNTIKLRKQLSIKRHKRRHYRYSSSHNKRYIDRPTQKICLQKCRRKNNLKKLLEKTDNDFINIANVLKLRRDVSRISNLEPLIQYLEKWPVISGSLLGTFTAPVEKTRASIYSVFDQYLRIFMLSDVLLQMMSQQTIDFQAFERDEKVACFLIMPDEKSTYHTLISLFIKQSYEYFIYAAQRKNGTFKRRINYVLDEFSALPRIKDFPSMITASRSRRIRFFLAIQSNYQLTSRYENEAQTIKANCNNWIFLTSKELETLKELSALGGVTATGRPLLSIHKLQHLSKERGEALLILGRNRPIYTELLDIEKYDGLSSPEQILIKDRYPIDILVCDALKLIGFEQNKQKKDLFEW